MVTNRQCNHLTVQLNISRPSIVLHLHNKLYVAMFTWLNPDASTRFQFDNDNLVGWHPSASYKVVSPTLTHCILPSSLFAFFILPAVKSFWAFSLRFRFSRLDISAPKLATIQARPNPRIPIVELASLSQNPYPCPDVLDARSKASLPTLAYRINSY
jgi:hypothetical protein